MNLIEIPFLGMFSGGEGIGALWEDSSNLSIILEVCSDLALFKLFMSNPT